MPRAIAHAKTEILAAARKVMAERGYAKLAMREVAAACGLATGTLYNYYKAKDAIVFELMLADWASFLAALDVRIAAARAEGGGRPADPKPLLRFAFEELRVYFGTYKDVWTQMAATPYEGRSDVVRAYEPGPFVRDLAARLGGALPPPGPGSLDRATALDVIVHLFSTYASLPGYGFEFLEPAVERLLA